MIFLNETKNLSILFLLNYILYITMKQYFTKIYEKYNWWRHVAVQIKNTEKNNWQCVQYIYIKHLEFKFMSLILKNVCP